MKRNSKLFVKDIIDAIDSIEKFVGKMNLDELQKDESSKIL